MSGAVLTSEETPLIIPSCSSYAGAPESFRFSIRNKLGIWLSQTVSFAISSFFLLLVVAWAFLESIPSSLRSCLRRPPTRIYEWDDQNKFRTKKFPKDVHYYAKEAGFDIIDEEIETEDGFLLR